MQTAVGELNVIAAACRSPVFNGNGVHTAHNGCVIQNDRLIVDTRTHVTGSDNARAVHVVDRAVRNHNRLVIDLNLTAVSQRHKSAGYIPVSDTRLAHRHDGVLVCECTAVVGDECRNAGQHVALLKLLIVLNINLGCLHEGVLNRNGFA